MEGGGGVGGSIPGVCVCVCLEITFLETGSQPWDSTSNFNTSLVVLLSCVSLATYVHNYVYVQK